MNELKQIDWKEKAISSSALKEAKKSTRALLWYYAKPKDTKSYFSFGSALELYILDKPGFIKNVAILDESKRPVPDKDYRTKENQEWKKKFYEENSEKYIIDSTGDESFETIIEFEKLLLKHEACDMLFNNVDSQPEFKWKCPISGLNRYSRPDLANKEEKIIIDIKTDADIDFTKSCVKNDHFLQAWDQIQGAIHSGYMDEVREYYWFVFSKKAPLYVDVYKFDIVASLRVEEVYNSILHRLKDDLQTDLSNMVFQNIPIQSMKVPNYYK